MQYVTVRVVDSSGSPRRDVRVALHVSQFAASGMEPESYTNSAGEAEFKLNVDSGATVTIYADGQEKVSNSSIRSEFRITI